MGRLARFGCGVSILAFIGAAPAWAHDFPSNNFDQAPLLSATGLEVAPGQMLMLRHNAMHWREDIYKNMVGGFVLARKVGSLEVPVAVTIGGQSLTAGKYAVIVKNTKADPAKFMLELKADGADTGKEIALAPKTSQWVYDHLVMTLVPTGQTDAGTFDLHLDYGTMHEIVAGQVNK